MTKIAHQPGKSYKQWSIKKVTDGRELHVMIDHEKKLICDLKTDMLEDELALLTVAFIPLLLCY